MHAIGVRGRRHWASDREIFAVQCEFRGSKKMKVESETRAGRVRHDGDGDWAEQKGIVTACEGCTETAAQQRWGRRWQTCVGMRCVCAEAWPQGVNETEARGEVRDGAAVGGAGS